MTPNELWLRNQIAQAERLVDKTPDLPFGDGGMSHHVAELKEQLAEELAAIARGEQVLRDTPTEVLILGDELLSPAESADLIAKLERGEF